MDPRLSYFCVTIPVSPENICSDVFRGYKNGALIDLQ